MQLFTNTASLNQAPLLEQPLFGDLIGEWQSLSGQTQGRLTAILGVNPVPVCRWKLARVQPFKGMLRYTQCQIARLNSSALYPIRDGVRALLMLCLASMKG